MYNLTEIEEFIKDFLKKEGCESGYIQIFNTRNTVGDSMRTIYKKDGITIDFCPGWWYLEIFGLNDRDYKTLLNKF